MTWQLSIVVSCLLHAFATAQLPGRITAEQGPSVVLRDCRGDACAEKSHKLVLDANWRWLHVVDGYTNCYDGQWSAAACPDASTCASRCALEGVDSNGYVTTYGVSSDGRGVSLEYVAPSGNVGSRLYLLDGSEYAMFNLKNAELSMEIDVSSLTCGMNAAIYLVSMKPGGTGPGATFGTGYCDAQCPRDGKFVDGHANLNWDLESCCSEIDLFEGNAEAMAWTLHPCRLNDCSKSGADVNSYRQGDRQFYGPGLTLDSRKPFEFATAFHVDGQELTKVTRRYRQGGRDILTPRNASEITSDTAATWKSRYGEENDFAASGGFAALSEALDAGMVLVLSIWDDGATHMNWLDSRFPNSAPPEAPGVLRGPCDPAAGDPSVLRSKRASVKISNITLRRLGTSGK